MNAFLLQCIVTPLFPFCSQSLEQRLHSATHSLQATPNSTIHSLQPPTHPPLVDLWGVGHMEAYQAEVGGYVGVATASEGGVNAATTDEVVKERSPLLETQEEEEVKVGCGVKGHHSSGVSILIMEKYQLNRCTILAMLTLVFIHMEEMSL